MAERDAGSPPELTFGPRSKGHALRRDADRPFPRRRPPSLTPREQEILAFLAAGKTDREIAETLFVSVRTVEGHVARILAKLGVRTRTAAAHAALVSGLVAVKTHRPTDRSR